MTGTPTDSDVTQGQTSLAAAPLRAPEQAPASPVAVQLRSLRRDFGDGRGVFGVSLEAGTGDVLALIGANGSGKSTLLRCATLFEPIDGGTITLAGVTFPSDVDRLSRADRERMHKMRGSVFVAVFQDSSPWPHLSVAENIALPLRKAARLPREEVRARTEEALALLGLEDRSEAVPWQLSGGLRQRLALARALAMRPSILFVDEGTSALDPDWTERVRSLFRAYADRGGTVIMISHRMGLVRRLADTVAFLHEGRLHELGSPDRLFRDPSSDELQRFLANA